MKSILVLVLLLSCTKKKDPESLIKERPEILSEEEIEELPEVTQ